MNTVEIYSAPDCGFCTLAKQELRKRGIGFVEKDISASAATRLEYSSRTHGARSVPQIFEAGALIGGYEDLVKVLRERGL